MPYNNLEKPGFLLSWISEVPTTWQFAFSFSLIHQWHFQRPSQKLCNGLHWWYPHVLEDQGWSYSISEDSAQLSTQPPSICENRKMRVSYHHHSLLRISHQPQRSRDGWVQSPGSHGVASSHNHQGTTAVFWVCKLLQEIYKKLQHHHSLTHCITQGKT